MPKKVVIDASVVVSACFGGHALEVISYSFSFCDIFISDEIVYEFNNLKAKLGRKLGSKQLDRFSVIIDRVISYARILKVSKEPKLCRDETDNKYLSICLKARTDYLLTRDKDLLFISDDALAKAGLKKLVILTPTDFLLLVARQQ